ncbi:MAG: DUF2125 domain-containing protein [Pararhodobacter sp.]|nr:DUF2125 domain-containing protein [Pararhodobacter sp.]
MRVIWALLSVAVIATLGWGGYWFVGARAMDRTVERVLAGNPAFSAASHSVLGFPNRFDLTLNEPRVEQGGMAWRAPFVQFFALSYRLNHVIAVFAHDQQFSLLGQEMSLHTEDMRASLVMAPGLALALERFALVAEAPALQSAGETHRADAARLATRAQDSHRHQAVIEVERAFPDPARMAAIDPAGHWPRRFDVLRLEAELEFDRPLDRHVLEGAEPRLVGLALTGARVVFDGVSITATGRLSPDARGNLSGEAVLTVTGWRELMQRARESGLMPAEHDTLATMALQSMTDPDNPERLEAPFVMRDGDVMLGPLVLGSVPPLF